MRISMVMSLLVAGCLPVTGFPGAPPPGPGAYAAAGQAAADQSRARRDAMMADMHAKAAAGEEAERADGFRTAPALTDGAGKTVDAEHEWRFERGKGGALCFLLRSTQRPEELGPEAALSFWTRPGEAEAEHRSFVVPWKIVSHRIEVRYHKVAHEEPMLDASGNPNGKVVRRVLEPYEEHLTTARGCVSGVDLRALSGHLAVLMVGRADDLMRSQLMWRVP
jgi:hypothetical protein